MRPVTFLVGMLSSRELRKAARGFDIDTRYMDDRDVERLVRDEVGDDIERLVDRRSGPISLDSWLNKIERRTEVRPEGGVRGVCAFARQRHPGGVRPKLVGPAPARRVWAEEVKPEGAPGALQYYQREALESVVSKVRPGNGGLLCLPTGAGKTKTAVWWCLTEHVRKYRRVVWLAGRDELIDQAAETFRTHASLAERTFTLRTIKGGAPEDYDGDVVVASLQTLAKDDRASALRRQCAIDAMVFDEAHHAAAPTYRGVLDDLGSSLVALLGLTATPTRTSEVERPLLRRIFPAFVIHEVPYLELMNRGILARPRHLVVPAGTGAPIALTEDDANYVRQWHELPQSILARLADDETRAVRVANVIREHLQELSPALVFAIRRDDASRICEELKQQNVRAEYVDGDTNKTVRRQFIEQLRAGELDALVNVQVLTEGTDVPKLRGVVIARPTFSETLYRQMVGRGSRGCELGGTREFMVVDFADNFSRFADMLAYKYALDAELPAGEYEIDDDAAPRSVRGGAARASAHSEPELERVLEALRVLTAEVSGGADDPERPILHRLSGWYTWPQPDTQYSVCLLVFETEAESLRRVIEALERTPTPTAARALWNEQLPFGLAPAHKLEQLAVALARGVHPEFVPVPEVEGPDLDALRRKLEPVGDPDERTRVLRDEYDAHPQWALRYPTWATLERELVRTSPPPALGYKVMCVNQHWTYTEGSPATTCRECGALAKEGSCKTWAPPTARARAISTGSPDYSHCSVMCARGHWTYSRQGPPNRCGEPACGADLRHDTLRAVGRQGG